MWDGGGTSWPDIGGGSGCGKTTYPCPETGSASTPCWRLSSVFEYIPSSTLGKVLNKQLEEKTNEMAGKVFILSSPKQVRTVMYEELKLVLKVGSGGENFRRC